MWNDKFDGYPIPVQNPMGMDTVFYPRVWVWIFTHNPFTDGRVITLPDPNPIHYHPWFDVSKAHIAKVQVEGMWIQNPRVYQTKPSFTLGL
jgi:hypothetical protein